MLYFLHGSDTDKARAKAHEMLAILQKKKPEAEVFRLDADNWSAGRLDELCGGQGLFERKFIVFASRLLENKEAQEAVIKKLPAIVQSENIFIFLEARADKPTLLAVEEADGKLQSFNSEIAKKEPFNVFALANALRARDRKALWVLYQKALRADVVPEAISGMLFWQVKNLFQKRGGKFSQAELEVLARKLVVLYHDAHRGLVDFETGLERLTLSL